MITETSKNALQKRVNFSDNFSGKSKPLSVSKSEPCRHCGKPDWCYRIGELEVCKRGELAGGWHKTSKHDSEGAYYLAPISQHKQPRPKRRRDFNYPGRDRNQRVKVVRTDDGNGNKKVWQERYKDGTWVKGLGDIKREDIPVYHYEEVKTAGLAGFPVFVTEGEPCVDALRKLGIIATTNIGGSGKWTDSDSADLEGCQVIICPDMDKPGIKHFLEIYKRHPSAKVLLPYPDSPLWDNLPDSGGLDVADWIEEYHLTSDAIFNQTMDITPELIQRLERQLNATNAPFEGTAVEENAIDETITAKSKASRLPKADVIGTEIAEDYQDKLAYNNENNSWMLYGLENPGVWQSISNEVAEAIISKELDSRGIVGYGSHNYVVDILKKLRCILIQPGWDEAPALEYLPFQDKVLNLKTREVIEHSPGLRFTWSLPRNYDENEKDWSLIESWLDEVTGGKDELKNIILCFCNAVLKGRYELQKFLFTTGHGGTGKTTLQNLLVELIGERNIHTTSLSEFCGNRFETANAYGKRLIIFPDEDKYSGNLQRFKDLTGGGRLRFERKGKDADRSFKYMGMVMMASNFPVFVGEQSSAIKRRVITVPFTQTPSKIDHQLFEKLTSQLNGFTNYLLSLPDELVTEKLLNAQDCAEVAFMEWEQRTKTDNVAWWLNEFVIRDENAKTPVGNNKNEARDVGGVALVTTLYGSYCQRVSDINKNPKSVTEFSGHLLDLCNNILGWKDVIKKHTNKCNAVFGLRLREIGVDDHIPILAEELVDKVEGEPFTPFTSQSQQAFEPSTTLFTELFTEPFTDDEREENIADLPQLISADSRVKGKVKGVVEDLNPYQKGEVKGVKGVEVFSSPITHNPFKEWDRAVYCGDNKDFWGEKVVVKQVLSATEVAIGVIGGFGKYKWLECHISDLKPLEDNEMSPPTG